MNIQLFTNYFLEFKITMGDERVNLMHVDWEERFQGKHPLGLESDKAPVDM